jgi:mRNA interferase RelE/StbE
MATYSLLFLPSVENDLRRLDPLARERLLLRCDQLATNPFPPRVRLLKGASGTYRLRVGQYRVIYSVDSVRHEVVIRFVRHRRDVYRRT